MGQISGGLLAGLCGVFLQERQNEDEFFKVSPEPLLDMTDQSQKAFAATIAEFSGQFVFTIIFLICSDRHLRMTKDKALNSLIIASGYIAARLMSGGSMVTGLPENETLITQMSKDGTQFSNVEVRQFRRTGSLLNPALGLGLQTISLHFEFIVPYVLAPFLGGVAAFIFHELLFLKSQYAFNSS
mmetsp:Transcript_4702/g.8019  ORF Transcript_4702/g.8019 Transcript_4702/m.8019 type:complete len:185 (+) Transcript_4702:374-928(+)